MFVYIYISIVIYIYTCIHIYIYTHIFTKNIFFPTRIIFVFFSLLGPVFLVAFALLAKVAATQPPSKVFLPCATLPAS